MNQFFYFCGTLFYLKYKKYVSLMLLKTANINTCLILTTIIILTRCYILYYVLCFSCGSHCVFPFNICAYLAHDSAVSFQHLFCNIISI